ncbi:MAG: outer membrane lipoprotein-sorting protein [Gammaproteobacteria bacterium]|nr:outer membrane lipoprotein-sorting protein [Gammaproteobacteria bacterium]
MKMPKLMGLVALTCASLTATAGVPKDLVYPKADAAPSAAEIAQQVYFVNHFYAVRNVAFEREGKNQIAVLVKRPKDGRATADSFRRFLNNSYQGGEIKARDMVLFHSGSLMGSGILVTDYSDDAKRQSYSVWLPETRKLNVFPEPAQDTSWSDSDLTYGDVYLRKPEHESHELLGTATLEDCLGAMQLSDKEANKQYLRQLPPPQCEHKGKAVYQLKSSSSFPNWWYDYRVSLVDTKTFADYRTEYFKNGQLVKRIDRDWAAMPGVEDPRGQLWRYWYASTPASGHETMVFVPEKMVKWNQDMEDEFWSEETLKALRK